MNSSSHARPSGASRTHYRSALKRTLPITFTLIISTLLALSASGVSVRGLLLPASDRAPSMASIKSVAERSSGPSSARTVPPGLPSTNASPGSLGNYATQGLTGVTTSITPSNVAANLTLSNLTRGTGITGVSATNAYNSSGWTTVASPDPNDYYEFTSTPNAGYQFSASELRIGLGRSSTGPVSAVLRTSLDGYSATIGSVIAVPTTTTTIAIDLSSVAGLQDSTSPVTFRIYGYGSSAAGGTMRIQQVIAGLLTVGLEMDGAVAAACAAPVITAEPSDSTIVYGQNAIFTASAAGDPAPTVQWEVDTGGGFVLLVNGGGVSGADTTTLTISNPTVAMSGYEYRAVFANDCFGTQTATTTSATLTVGPLAITVMPDSGQAKVYGGAEPVLTYQHSPSLIGGDAFSGALTRVSGEDAGSYNISQGDLALGANYSLNFTGGVQFQITPAPTVITPNADVTGVNNDCVNNVYTATLTDSVTGQHLGGINLKMTIGTQSVTADTDSSELAAFTLTLSQPMDVVTQTFELNEPWTDTNRTPPAAVMRNFTVSGDPDVGPGTDADSMYTGSLFFWTTSATSSTATLTLSATIKDTFDVCPMGDITQATVSFYVSSNGGGSFSPVSNAQDLPVGLVDPNEPNVGTATAISQYNIGNSDSTTLIVRVVVGGHYNFSSSEYDIPITIGKPGTANSLMGGGKLKNDGDPFYASGYFGINSIGSTFGSQLQYNKKGTNPQGQVTVYVRSCNFADGTVDPVCVPSDPSTHHVYFIKSNSISELSLIGGSASFGSKANVAELMPGGTKVSLDGGNLMQLMFTPYGITLPPNNAGNPIGTTCTFPGGCASIIIYRSSAIGGGVWYSSSWGQSTAKPLQTWLKQVVNGTVVVQ